MSNPISTQISVRYQADWSDEMVLPFTEDIRLFSLSKHPLNIEVQFFLTGITKPVLSTEGILTVSGKEASFRHKGSKVIKASLEGENSLREFAEEVLGL